MPVIETIRAIFGSILQLGKGGPNIKNNAGTVEFKNNADSAFVNASVLTPTANQHAANKAYVDALTGQNIGAGSEVFKLKSGSNLQFRKINQGAGINVNQNANDITISATVSGVKAAYGYIIWGGPGGGGSQMDINFATGAIVHNGGPIPAVSTYNGDTFSSVKAYVLWSEYSMNGSGKNNYVIPVGVAPVNDFLKTATLIRFTLSVGDPTGNIVRFAAVGT